MTIRIGLIVLLVLGFSLGGDARTAAGQSRNPNDDAHSSIAPPFVTPGKDLYVAREGDSFVVAITATCYLEDDSDAQFELSPASPSFVHVSDTYRREHKANGYAEGVALVYVTPQVGDAGKHVVSLQVRACSGKVERLITFGVRVKQARQE